jgi:hypothetical protein
MKYHDEKAFPSFPNFGRPELGLSKREYVATFMMQELLAYNEDLLKNSSIENMTQSMKDHTETITRNIAQRAAKYADALLDALNEEPKTPTTRIVPRR